MNSEISIRRTQKAIRISYDLWKEIPDVICFALLQKNIVDKTYKLTNGTYKGQKHSWLQNDTFIIDPTSSEKDGGLPMIHIHMLPEESYKTDESVIDFSQRKTPNSNSRKVTLNLLENTVGYISTLGVKSYNGHFCFTDILWLLNCESSQLDIHLVEIYDAAACEGFTYLIPENNLKRYKEILNLIDGQDITKLENEYEEFVAKKPKVDTSVKINTMNFSEEQ